MYQHWFMANLLTKKQVYSVDLRFIVIHVSISVNKSLKKKRLCCYIKKQTTTTTSTKTKHGWSQSVVLHWKLSVLPPGILDRAWRWECYLFYLVYYLVVRQLANLHCRDKRRRRTMDFNNKWILMSRHTYWMIGRCLLTVIINISGVFFI